MGNPLILPCLGPSAEMPSPDLILHPRLAGLHLLFLSGTPTIGLPQACFAAIGTSHHHLQHTEGLLQHSPLVRGKVYHAVGAVEEETKAYLHPLAHLAPPAAPSLHTRFGNTNLTMKRAFYIPKL